MEFITDVFDLYFKSPLMETVVLASSLEHLTEADLVCKIFPDCSVLEESEKVKEKFKVLLPVFNWYS